MRTYPSSGTVESRVPALSGRSFAEGPDDVAEVRAEEDYRLYVRFFDGTQGHVEMKEMIFSTNAKGFAELVDPRMFAQVGLGFGSVLWANGMDLAPDTMYEELKRNGVWVLC